MNAVDTGAPGYDAADEFLDRISPVQRLQSTLHTYPWISPALVLALVFLFFSSLAPGIFNSQGTISTIIQQASVVATLGLGQTLIILTAGIDLSCGAIMVFASMVMAKTAQDYGINGILALGLGLVVGAMAGLLNGWLVTAVKLPPFIVTLGSLGIFSSLTLLYATGRTVRRTELAPELNWMGIHFDLGAIGLKDFGLTLGVLLMLALYLLFAFVLRYTAWGTHVYAVGDDPEAARLAGIQVSRVLLSVYLVAGVIFAVASYVMIGRVGAASPNNAVDANLDAITAVVIGGTSLFGGRGRVIGTLIGALIVASVDLGLTVADLDPNYKPLSIGILIIVAVAADQWIRKARA